MILQLHGSLIDMAKRQLLQGKVDERHVGSLVLAFQKDDYPAAVEAIEKFQREFDQRFGCENGQGDEIYCYSTQFFKIEGEKNAD